MKYCIEFRDPRVQTVAEALFTPAQLRFQMVGKALPVAPQSAESRRAAEDILRDAEADIARARQLLLLVDMAVALNGGSYEKILKFSDNPEDNPSGRLEDER